jgi:tRNA(Arg) A34 adenosine deaminase TadA
VLNKSKTVTFAYIFKGKKLISEGNSGLSSNSISYKSSNFYNFNKKTKKQKTTYNNMNNNKNNKHIKKKGTKKQLSNEDIERCKDRGFTGHAETVAIKRLKSSKGKTIVIARLKTNGDFAMAKPCITCIQAIKLTNIKHIWYTTDTGWKYESVKMIYGEYSSGLKRYYEQRLK